MNPRTLGIRSLGVVWLLFMATLGWSLSAWIITHWRRPSSEELRGRPPAVAGSALPASPSSHIPRLHERIARCFPPPPTQSSTADGSLTALHATDLERLISLDSAGEDGSLVRRVAECILFARFLENPEHSVSLLTPLAVHNATAQRSLQSLLDEWARKDPDRAWHALNSLPPRCFAFQYSDETLGTELLRWKARSDPDTAITFVLDHIDEASRTDYWGLISRELAAHDLDAARTALTRMTGNRSEAVDAVLERWAETEPLKALAWCQQLDSVVRRAGGWLGGEIGIVRAWAKHDPVAAIAAAEEYGIGTPSGASGIETILIHDWLSRDPQAALRWWLSRDDHPKQVHAQMLKPFEPESLIESVRAVSPESEGALALGIARQWAREDPRATLTWLQSLPPSPESDAARMAMIGSLGGRSEPPERRAFVEDNLETLWRPQVELDRLWDGLGLPINSEASNLVALILDTPDFGRQRLLDLSSHEQNKGGTALLYILADLGAPLTGDIMTPRLDSLRPSTSLEILSSWSRHHPIEAARFLLDHADQIHPTDSKSFTDSCHHSAKEIANAVRPRDAGLADSVMARFPKPPESPPE